MANFPGTCMRLAREDDVVNVVVYPRPVDNESSSLFGAGGPLM